MGESNQLELMRKFVTILATSVIYWFNYTVIKEDTGWVGSHKRGYTHCCILVQCVGLPENSFVNGTFPNLIYKKYKETFYSVVRREKPLILDSIETDTTKIKGTVVVCTTMYGYPAKFNHCLTYQKLLVLTRYT